MATKAELEARIWQLEKKLAQNQELLTWSQNAIDDPDGQIKVLTNEIANKDREIKALEDELYQLNDEVRLLKDEVKASDEAVSRLEYQIDELKTPTSLQDNKLDENLDIFDSCVGKMCISYNSLSDSGTVELLKALLYNLQPNTIQDELKSLVDKYGIKY